MLIEPPVQSVLARRTAVTPSAVLFGRLRRAVIVRFGSKTNRGPGIPGAELQGFRRRVSPNVLRRKRHFIFETDREAILNERRTHDFRSTDCSGEECSRTRDVRPPDNVGSSTVPTRLLVSRFVAPCDFRVRAREPAERFRTRLDSLLRTTRRGSTLRRRSRRRRRRCGPVGDLRVARQWGAAPVSAS